MAPPPDHVYFPSLLELLEGETVLLTWKLVASALADTASDRLASSAVLEFLKDAHVLHLLTEPAGVFAAADAQTKTAFETKTAAIHVPETANEKYDIKAIKADALWLAKCAGISETAALRIVTIELQSRPQAFLATPLSSQDATNIRKAAVGSLTALTQTGSAAMAGPALDAETAWIEFGSEQGRRQRLLATYLSERRYFSMATDYVTSLVLVGRLPSAAGATGEDLQARLAAGLLKSSSSSSTDISANSEGSASSYLPLLDTYIGALRACMSRADAGVESAISDKELQTEELAIDWVLTALTEAAHFLSAIFLILQSCSRQFLPISTTMEWFRFLSDYRFLDGLTPADTTMEELVLPLKTLVCANTLIFLNLDYAIGYLDHDLEIGPDEEPYLNNQDALDVMHAAIVSAADDGLPTASPIFFAWSLIIHRMEVSYQERAERRDLAQNQRAQDGFELEYQPSQIQALRPRGRRSSVGSIVSIEAARYDGFLNERVLSLGEGDALVPRLAMTATDGCHMFDVISVMAACAGCDGAAAAAFCSDLAAGIRQTFLELLRASIPIIGYQADPVSALLAVLSGGHELWNAPVEDDAVASAVLQDKLLLNFYFRNALNRFPFEFGPFVSMCRLLARCTTSGRDSDDGQDDDDGLPDFVFNLLLRTPSLTFSLPAGFDGYAMIDEEDNATATMQTTEDIVLFPSGSSRRRLAFFNDTSKKASSASVIPAGTYGRFMIDGSGIVHVDYEHSTLALLGKWLDSSLTEELYAPVLGRLQPADTAEAVGLLTALIRSETTKAARGSGGTPDAARVTEAGLAVLQEVSRDLSETKDIVTVVCDTLDTLIQDGPAETDEPRMAILAACVDFLSVVLPLCPGRVWSYMARCQLLNTESSAGRLSILTGASDVTTERYNFLMASVRLLCGLVESAISSAIQRKVSGKLGGQAVQLYQSQHQSQHQSQQRMEETMWLGSSDIVLVKVTLSVAQTVVDIYENTSTWKFASEVHRTSLVAGAVDILRDIVVSASSLESLGDGRESLLAVLQPAAEFIVTSFVSSSSSALRFQPLLSVLLSGLCLPPSTLYPVRLSLAVSGVSSVLQMAATLVRIANTVDATGRATPIETQIFQIASLPARLCALHPALKQPALDLLTDLVITTDATAHEPPSLLGYLGPQISRSFLGVLSAMDKPFQRPTETANVWKFFSTILRHRQQWMANCLLTGKTPREALKSDGKVTKLPSTSALAKAKDELQRMATMTPGEAMAILDFLSAAQNYWPWTILSSRTENDYLDNMRLYIRELAPSATTAKTNTTTAASQAKMATYIAEILAMQLYHLRQMGTDEAFARSLVQDLDYYLRDGVAVAGYNASLHANFQRNFANRYPGCSLEQLKRAATSKHELGTRFYYALEVADRMLRFDGAWVGLRDPGTGFQNEMQTANANLSLVDAQVSLFHAWELLLLELSVCLLPQNKRLPLLMLQVAEQCLAANQSLQGPELIFAKVAQRRANLALLLLQRLSEYGLLPRDVSKLLLTVWGSISSAENVWSAEQAPYYRTLLRILYIVLRGSRRGGGGDSSEKSAAAPAADAADAAAETWEGDAMVVSTTQTVLNILDRVVCGGFRTLVAIIHDADAESQPGDVALLTAVLQACLSTPGVAQCQTEVLNIAASHDVLHVALSLFSWSDKLVVYSGGSGSGGGSGNGGDRDPVYGELSLLFLLELSSLPVVAEQLACDGFLGHLAAAGLAQHMRRPGVSPLADNVAAQRCYSIWTKAVLPLMINILMALGTSIAPEVAYVLNQFPNLLEASVQRLEAPGLSRTAEVSSLRQGGPHITLLAANEAHSLALLTQVLTALRVRQGAREIAEVAWGAASLLESIDIWLSRPKLLRERLVPLGAREVEWRNMPPLRTQSGGRAGGGDGGGLAENRLEEQVFSLLYGVRTILADDDEEE